MGTGYGHILGSRKDNMRIVHINTQDVEGGAARMALRLAHEQRRNNHKASLLVGRKSLSGDFSQRFDSMPNELLRPFCEASKLPYFFFQGSHGLSGHPLVKVCDILHIHNIHFDFFNPFSLSFLSHSKPTVWTLHDLFPVTGFCIHPGNCKYFKDNCSLCYRQQLNEPFEFKKETGEGQVGPALSLQWKRMIYEHSHLTFVCPSLWMRQQVENSILSDMNVKVIPNGIDTITFCPRDKHLAKKKLGIPLDVFVIGAVAVQGALDNPLKGGAHLQTMIENLYQKHSKVILLNIGSDRQDPTAYIRNVAHINSQEDLSWAYAAMDVFVHAAAAESFCLVAVEAMACNLPVVVFDVGPLPELVLDQETGFLCPEQDAKSLFDAVDALLKDKALRKRFGRAGRERSVTFFDFEKVNSSYVELYFSEIQARAQSDFSVKIFDLGQVPALIKTPEFIAAESLKIGKNISNEALTKNLIESFLEELSDEKRLCLAPLHEKALNIQKVFHLRNQGKLKSSLSLLEDLIKRWPGDLTLWRTKGVTLGLMGKLEEALITFNVCLEGEPPLHDVWLNMADIHLRSGDLDACEKALNIFHKIDPNLRGVQHRLGMLFVAQKKFREAVYAFVAELRLHGSSESVEPLRSAWKKRNFCNNQKEIFFKR